MKAKRKIWALLAVLIICSLGVMQARAAIKEMEVDYDVYSLWVEEVPEGIYDSTYIAAKLTKTSLDPELYTLSMIDDVDSETKLHNAMKFANMPPEKNRSFAMDVRLYEYDEEEGDYYLSDNSDVEVIVPVADVMYQYDENDDLYLQTGALKVVQLDASEKILYPSYELVSVDEVICAKFKVTDNGVYGFILKGVAPESSEDEEEYEEEYEEIVPTSTPTPEPTKAPTATPSPVPAKAPTATPSPVPTKAPTATPSPVLTKAPTATPSPVPTKAPTATPSPTPTAVPTVMVEINKDNGAGEKDKTPQTGDEHNSALLLLLGSVSVLTLVAVIRAWKREEREEM